MDMKMGVLSTSDDTKQHFDFTMLGPNVLDLIVSYSNVKEIINLSSVNKSFQMSCFRAGVGELSQMKPSERPSVSTAPRIFQGKDFLTKQGYQDWFTAHSRGMVCDYKYRDQFLASCDTLPNLVAKLRAEVCLYQ